MKYIKTFSDNKEVSQVALGCMRIGNMSDKEADFYLGNTIDLGINFGVLKNDLNEVAPRINELAFDSDRKLMTTVVKETATGKVTAYTKGAVDRLIPLCTKIVDADGTVRPVTAEDHKNIDSASFVMAQDALFLSIGKCSPAGFHYTLPV